VSPCVLCFEEFKIAAHHPAHQHPRRYNQLMATAPPVFREPTTVEKMFNRAFGFLVGLGLGFAHSYLLEVRGRKSGKLFSTPVDLLELRGKRFLVAPRGRTQWVRNAEAAGEISLKSGRTRLQFHLRPLTDAEKPEVLKTYLDRYKSEVQRFFPVPAGSPPAALAPIAASYPAFELLSI
jgi:deazaflavin-dependent oxidoreductase (nitroreductase family)